MVLMKVNSDGTVRWESRQDIVGGLIWDDAKLWQGWFRINLNMCFNYKCRLVTTTPYSLASLGLERKQCDHGSG